MIGDQCPEDQWSEDQWPQKRPLLLGHRGARADKTIPENTVASFDLALAQGCDGFEFDVRLSVDQDAVICHDAKTGGCEIAQSFNQQLALPLLRDVLDRYRTAAFLDIELKIPGSEKVAMDLLRMFPPARGHVISSFLPEVLRTMHDLDAGIPLGLICETRAEFNRWRELPVAYVILHYKLVRRNVVAEIKAAGKKILVWTVNTPAGMKRLAGWGVDGIISDNPKLLVRTLSQKNRGR